MTFKTALASTIAALLLSGCANGTFGGFLLGGGISIADAEAARLALENRVDVFIAEGDTLTADLPGAGTANYTGIIHGSGPDMVHYADLSVDVNFATDTLDGEVSNFVTDVSGFQNPTGTATVAGTVIDSGGFAELDFTATGTLIGTNSTADYLATAPTGNFAGDTAQAAYGSHITNFEWTAGPNIGTTSFSDGDWNLE